MLFLINSACLIRKKRMSGWRGSKGTVNRSFKCSEINKDSTVINNMGSRASSCSQEEENVSVPEDSFKRSIWAFVLLLHLFDITFAVTWKINTHICTYIYLLIINFCKIKTYLETVYIIAVITVNRFLILIRLYFISCWLSW